MPLTYELLQGLNQATTPEEIERLLRSAMSAGSITQDEAADFFDMWVDRLETPGTTIPSVGTPEYLDYMLGSPAPAGTTTPETPTPTGETKWIGTDLYELWTDGKWHIVQAAETTTTPTIPSIPSAETTTATPPSDFWVAVEEARVQKDLETLQRLLDLALNRGWVTTEQYDRYVGEIEAYNYYSAYTSEKDLADRLATLIAQGTIDFDQAVSIYNETLGITEDKQADTGMLIRAGQERVAGGEAEAAAISASPDVLKYLSGLKIVLDAQVRAGNMTQAQADQTYSGEQTSLYQGTKFSDLPYYDIVIAQLGAEEEGPGIIARAKAEEATSKQREAETAAKLEEFLATLSPEQRAAVKGQTLEQAKESLGLTPQKIAEREMMFGKAALEQAEANRLAALAEEKRIQALPWMSRFKPQAPPLPAQPTYKSVYEPFLAAIGAPNFRRFVESELGKIAEKTAGARAEWWKGQNQPAPLRPFEDIVGAAEMPRSYAELVSELQTEGTRLGELLGRNQAVGGPGWALQRKQDEINARLSELYGMGKAEDEYSRDIRRQQDANNAFLAQLYGLSEEQKAQTPNYAAKVEELRARGNELGALLAEYKAPEQAYGELMERERPLSRPKVEDPFSKALKDFPFLSEYMAKPPEERQFYKQRYAPRVQFRF